MKFAFQGREADHLSSCARGDALLLVSRAGPDGFYTFRHLTSGESGLLPVSFVTELSPEEAAAEMVRPQAAIGTICRAKQSSQVQGRGSADHLSYDAGDLLVLISRTQADRWTFWHVETGKTGLVDVRCVGEVKASEAVGDAAEAASAIKAVYQEEDESGTRGYLHGFTQKVDQLIAEIQVHESEASREEDLRKFRDWSDGVETALAQLAERVATWQQQHTQNVKRMEARREKRSVLLRRDIQSLIDGKLKAEALLLLPVADLVHVTTTAEKFIAAFGIYSQLQQDRDTRYVTKLPLSQHPAKAILKKVHAPSLLPSLSVELRAELQGFLPAEKQMTAAQLLYKASRDGWTAADFFRCCCEKGPTLTIIRAADTGYIFGAYTAVSWPKPTDQVTVVPDPSGTSFLFSLTNVHRRPFRLSLVDRSRAITVCSRFGPIFGSQVDVTSCTAKLTNLILMQSGRPADEKNGNYSAYHNQQDDGCAYQLDAWPEGLAPLNEYTRKWETLAGMEVEDFAAAQIEVYTF